MAAKQRHVQKVRQRIIDKLRDVDDQEQALHEVVSEYVAKARVRAESVLGLEDTGQFLQQYNAVLQMLDGVYNICELLTASAEDITANGGDDLYVDTFAVDTQSVAGDTTLPSPTSRLSHGVSQPDPPQEQRDSKSLGTVSATKSPPTHQSMKHLKTAGRQSSGVKSELDSAKTEHLGSSEATTACKSQNVHMPRRWRPSPSIPSSVKEQFNKELGIGSETKELFETEDDLCHKTASGRVHDQRRGTRGAEVEIDDFLSGDVKSPSHKALHAGAAEVQCQSRRPAASHTLPSHRSGSHRRSRQVNNRLNASATQDKVTSESKQSQQTKQQPETAIEPTKAVTASVVDNSCVDIPSNRPSSAVGSVKASHTVDETPDAGYRKGLASLSPDGSVDTPHTVDDPPDPGYMKGPAIQQGSVDTPHTADKPDSGHRKGPAIEQGRQNTVDDPPDAGYRKGPAIERGSLLEGNITPVLITDITSPWCFYVQPYGPQINELMEQICLYMAKSGLTDVPLTQPAVGTVCLARYSKDNAFYRALVTGTCMVGSTMTEVDVFFLDYGNRERVKMSQLRKLPDVYASLPTQAICCALAEVVPTNKYNVWTEEDILTFQQFVFSQQLRCMLVCHSSGPSMPYIVNLTMNYPVPATQGMVEMNVAYAYLAEISVGKLLVSKGQAKTIAVTDQVGLIIKSLEGTSDAVVINGRSGTTLEITELTDAQVKVIEASEGQSKSTSSGSTQGSLGEKGNRDDDKRVVPRTDRQGREHFRIKKDGTREDVGDNAKLCVADVDVSVPVDDGKADKARRDTDLHSPRSETSETEFQGDVKMVTESDSSDLQQSCVKSDPYLPAIVEERDVCDSQSTSSINKETPDPIDETTSVSTDLDTTKNSADTGFMSGDLNVDLSENKGHEVMLSHVKSPGHFYLHLVSRQVGHTLDTLMKKLNAHFERLKGKRRTKLSKSFTCAVDKKCCARFSEDGHFYRAVIVSMDGPANQPSSTSLVHIFYLDFGDDEWLSPFRLYPLPGAFCDIPPLALRCRLAFVKPLVLAGEDRAGRPDHWPDTATEQMVSMTGFNRKLLMHVIHGTLCTDSKGQVVGYDNNGLEILLVDHAGPEEICINMEMIREKQADLELAHTPFPQKGPEDSDVMPEGKDWNPMAQDFFSIRNSYNIDVDDPGVATTGYKARDESRICKYFSKGQSCWRGERCPYRHVLVHSGVTLDREEVYCVDNNQLDILPDLHAWVALEVTTILSPAHFYAILPLGTRSLNGTASEKDVKPGQFGDVESTETLDDLLAALNAEYSNKTYHADSLILRAPGEIVAARFSKDAQWYRARVLQATEEKVKVFYVDFGNSEWVSARDLREMKPEFLHLPFQSLECFLHNVEAGRDGDDSNRPWTADAKQCFQTLVDGKTLVGHVKSKWWNGVLFVELYDTSRETDVNVGEALVRAGHAHWASGKSTSSCPSESGASTASSGVRMIPG